ncbi:MAG: MFS transporter [Acidimicrobiales bacterium]|nr:MFS transporter [Acidimicrobiales bacterium]
MPDQPSEGPSAPEPPPAPSDAPTLALSPGPPIAGELPPAPRVDDPEATEHGSVRPAPTGDGGLPPSLQVRLFGTHAFFRLWLSQVVSSLGDWIGFVAIVAVAGRVGGSSPEAAIGLVMSARIIPGLFLASVAGVLVDRWDRKRVMVVSDLGRALVLATLPFIDSVAGLVAASFLLEIGTLFWSPAKEASVPNLVPADHLTTANSLSLVAAYGTFPIASLVFAGLAKLAEVLSGFGPLGFLDLNQESLAIYFDVFTFVVSAAMIATLPLVRRTRVADGRRIDLAEAFRELKEGWRFIAISPRVRAVMLGIGTGLIGGGMLVPLGPVFAQAALGSGPAGFGLLLTALGTGVAIGVVAVSALQSRLDKTQVFSFAVLGGGICLVAAASTSSLGPAFALVLGLGVCAGSVYVLGFTILQESVGDDLRGRVFSTLYALVRLCLLVSFAFGPFLATVLGRISTTLVEGEVSVGGAAFGLPGVRLALWLGGFIIIGAGVLAIRTFRSEGSAVLEPPPAGAPAE